MRPQSLASATRKHLLAWNVWIGSDSGEDDHFRGVTETVQQLAAALNRRDDNLAAFARFMHWVEFCMAGTDHLDDREYQRAAKALDKALGKPHVRGGRPKSEVDRDG